MVSPYYLNFLSKNLANQIKEEEAVKILNLTFSFTSNIPTVRNVAEATSFCTYYSLLLQKYGLIQEYNKEITEIGTKVHDLLSLASINLFHPSKPKIYESDVLNSIDKAKKDLEEIHKETENEDFVIDIKTLQLATNLMRRLIFEALRQLVNKKVISDYAFFPIVEQTFLDFDYKLYGTPDLILEREDFAIVVEWKSHSIDDENDSPREKDMAQVIAYSIFEAKRLGINSYDKIFEAISGLTIEEVESLNESVDENRIMKEALERLKILPVVVGRKGGFPPHPLLLMKGKRGDTVNRFKRMLRLFKGVIVGAEYLTLQLTNVEGLLWGYYSPEEIKEVFKSTIEKPIYQLTPDYLQWRKPGGESEFCKTRCPIVLSNSPINPCKDYFVHKENRTNLDKEEWAERSEVLSKRDRGFLSHKVINLILDEEESEKLENGERYIYRVKLTKEGIEVERIKTQESVNTVRVYKGKNQLLAFKFDLFNKIYINDNRVVLYRDVREEEKKGKGGVLRNLITISLLEKNKVLPTLSISTPIEVSETRQIDGKVYLSGVASSFTFYKSLKRFEYYLKYYENKDHLFLAYESYSDLSSIENKGIYITYELLRKVEPKDTTVLEKLKKILGDD